MMIKIALPLVLCLYSANVVKAQGEKGKNEAGIQVGGMFYNGDLASNAIGSAKAVRGGLAAYYSRSISPYFSLRANLVMGSLSGDDSLNKKPAYMRRRNFRFNTPVNEVSLLVQYDVFGSNFKVPANKISPYVFAGVGLSFVTINRDWSRTDTSLTHAGSSTLAGLQRDSAATLPKTVAIVPVGAGVKYQAWQRVALMAEFNYRLMFSDYLDGFSYAANPNRKDGYYSLTVGAVFNFGSSGKGNGSNGRGSVDCPKVRVF